jgi:predicted amidophosphoribosyltransferase
MAWWAAGRYEGSLRRVLLNLRRDPRSQQMAALLDGLVHRLQPIQQAPLLIPIPSWKRKANPLPLLLAHQLRGRLGWPCRPNLLERRHPVLGQHRLDRELRWQNQQGAFGCPLRPRHPSLPRGVRTVMLIDDILTTGATACAAAAALEAMGWQVLGLTCLGRTPSKGGPAARSRERKGGRGAAVI